MFKTGGLHPGCEIAIIWRIDNLDNRLGIQDQIEK